MARTPGNGVRCYEMIPYQHGRGISHWPPRYVTAIGVPGRFTAAVIFRRWFGRRPSKVEGSHGYFIASNRRGDRIHLEQLNQSPEEYLPMGSFPLIRA